MAIERRDVLMRRRLTQAEARGHLFLTVSLQETGERLPQARGEAGGARLRGTHECTADEGPDLAMQKVNELLLTRGKICCSLHVMGTEHARRQSEVS
jgi:hypothetical protein